MAAIATLALGVGANTAIFSLIDAALLEPLPYPDADRIVQIRFTTPNGADTNHSIPAVNLLAKQSEIFEEVTAYYFGGPGVNLTGGEQPEQVQAARMELGRGFTAGEDRPNSGRAAVIGHALWIAPLPCRAGRRGAHYLSRRRIRLALGARPYQVRGMMLSQGVRLALAGLLKGASASLACSGT